MSHLRLAPACVRGSRLLIDMTKRGAQAVQRNLRTLNKRPSGVTDIFEYVALCISWC